MHLGKQYSSVHPFVSRRFGVRACLIAASIVSACSADPYANGGLPPQNVANAPPAAVPTAGTTAMMEIPPVTVATAGVPAGGAAGIAMGGAGGAGGMGGSADHAAHGGMGGMMADAHDHCALHSEPDPRDAMLTSEPKSVTVGFGEQDLLVPQIVLDWMDERQFAESHDGWHLVRKWDQTCRKSNATTSCAAAKRLEDQGLTRAPIQQGAPGDGLAFMMMHRHMIAMLKTAFPKNAKLFDGFVKVPKTKSDAENPHPWADIRWTSGNMRGFDTLENIEQHLDQFPTEDDLGQYIENTYKWTPQTPMSPLNAPGSGLHGALHSQWSVSGSPANLIQQSVDVKNYAFWKLHGWIDNVWERYRKAKGLKNDDPAYQKLLVEQCMEMYMLQPRNRTGMKPGSTGGAGTGGSTAPETGAFAQSVRPFLDRTCGGCHSAIAPSAGMTLGGPGISSSEIIDGLVGMKASNGEYNLIEPGNPQKSWVYLKASNQAANATCNNPCDREPMPPSGMGLSTTELDTLRQWITSGATKM